MGIRNAVKEASLSLSRARELLSYDAETGKLTWRKPPRRGVGVMSEVGCVRPDGYRTVTIDGNAFLAANLIWFLVYGEWPVASVDHENRVRSDDRFCNLRPATQTENNFNQKIRVDNSLGIRGVTPDTIQGGFVASLTKDGKLITRKRFRAVEDAISHRKAMEQIHCGAFLPQEQRVQ